MNRSLVLLIAAVFFPTFICRADTASNGMPTHPDVVLISHGFSTLKINSGTAHEVKIDHRAREKSGVPFSLVKTAEAAVRPNELTLKDFENICAAVKGAARIDDLKPVLSEKYFQVLKAKIDAGASQYVVLAMLQAMRPKEIRITDFHIEETMAQLAVAGPSYVGPMQGLIHLIKTDGAWRIDAEEWYAGGKSPSGTHEPVAAAYNTLAGTTYDRVTGRGILSNISPDYAVNRNFLSLTRVNNDRRKRAIMFVFLMNKDKKEAAEDASVKMDTIAKVKQRTRMHVLWSGPKKLMPEQHVIENKYPMDVSIAKYDDGYAPGEWNLVLPGKKPREVRVSLLWSF